MVLAVEAATIAAWGSMGTVVVTVLLAFYAARQVKEAKRLREEQTRPFVVVSIEPDWAASLVVENIGATMATDVRIHFDPPFQSHFEDEPLPIFREEGIPSLPPGMQLRFNVISMIQYLNDRDVPGQYRVTVTCRSFDGSRPYKDTYLLDLDVFEGIEPPPEGLPELVKAVEKVTKELHGWTDGAGGLLVHAEDRRRFVRRERRYRSRSRFRRDRAARGLVGALRHRADRWWARHRRRRR